MDDHRLKTIAFPAISTGIFGYPIERCAKIMISTAKKYLNGETQIRQVVLCLYSEPDYEVFNKELNWISNSFYSLKFLYTFLGQISKKI